MISDLGKYSGFGYPDIQIPIEITSIYVYVYLHRMYICIYYPPPPPPHPPKKKTKKNPKNCDLLPLGSLFLLGLNSTLSSYSQSRSEKKGGGGNLSRLPGNQLVLAYLDLWGHVTLGQLGLLNFVYDFT